MQLQVKTILNAIQHFPGFVYQDIRLVIRSRARPRELHITVRHTRGVRPSVRAATDPPPAMIACPRGPGCLCRCGGWSRGLFTPPGGCSARSTAW